MLFSMSLSFDANRLKAYAMSETSSVNTEENIEIYFERSDGEIVKPDSDGKFTLTSIDTGKFKIKGFSGTPYFQCSTEEKEGIERWTDVWVTYDGKYQGHGIKEVTARVYSKDPIYPDAKLLRDFKINNKSSKVERLIPYIDGKAIADDETVSINGSEYKKINLKGTLKGSDKEIDIPAYAVTIKYTNGSYVQNNGEDIYTNINTSKASEATINIKMTDESAKTKFHLAAKNIPLTGFDINYPKLAYISDWNGLNGNQYIGVTPSDTVSDRNYKLTFEPATATNKNLKWEALNPEIAEYQELFGNGIVPKKSGIAEFKVTSEENPSLKKTVKIEFKYRYPLLSASTAKTSYELKENEYHDIEIATNPTNATEQRFDWSFDTEGIARIDELVTRTSTSEPHKTTHRLVALSKGKVKAVGTPIDTTGGATPITLEIVVKEADSSSAPDYVKLAKDLLEHGKTNLLNKSHSKYGDEWTLFTLARSGADISKSDKDAYLASVRKILDENEDSPSLIPTEYSKLALTLGSIGIDPSTEENYNIIAKIYNDKRISDATSNTAIFALIALDSKEYVIPDGAFWTREKLVDQILSYQKESGGFSLNKSGGDGIDITAMALQSLAPYYKDNAKVKTAVDKALNYLEKRLDATGSYGGNSCTDAQVLTALSALGIDASKSEKFSKLNSNLVANMAKYKADNGFGIGIGGDANDFANTQVSYSLSAYLRFVEAKPALYKFTDVEFSKSEADDSSEFDSVKMYALIDKLLFAYDLPLPEKKDEVLKVIDEYNEMLKITPDDYLAELKDVEYIVAAMNGKMELMDLVDKFDYKENTEKAKTLLKEGIDKIASNVDDEASAEVINRTTEHYKELLENLKTNKAEAPKDPIRLAGPNRYETAIQIADTLKKELGKEKFNVIVVANGDNYPDALSGAYLAKVKNAPLLLVNEHNKDRTIKYIEDNLKPGRSTIVYLLGGTNAIPDDVRLRIKKSFNVKRLAGNDRFATNLAILKEAKVDNEELVICSGYGFADSISASATGRPIFLVGDGLTEEQLSYLNSIRTKNYAIAGGLKSVNATIEASLNNLGSSKRIFGEDRYKTSIAIARYFFKNPRIAILSYGNDFPDGLCGGIFADRMGGPLLLIDEKNIEYPKQYVKDNSIKESIILGGNRLISDATASYIVK